MAAPLSVLVAPRLRGGGPGCRIDILSRLHQCPRHGPRAQPPPTRIRPPRHPVPHLRPVPSDPRLRPRWRDGSSRHRCRGAPPSHSTRTNRSGRRGSVESRRAFPDARRTSRRARACCAVRKPRQLTKPMHPAEKVRPIEVPGFRVLGPRVVRLSVRCGVTDHHDAETLSMSGRSCIFSGLAALEQKRPGRAGAMQ